VSDNVLVRNSDDLIAAYRRLVDAAADDDDDGYRQAAATVERLVDKIGTMTPETINGLQAKAKAAFVVWAAGEDDICPGDPITALARSLIRDLAWMPVFESGTPRARRRLTLIEGGLQDSESRQGRKRSQLDQRLLSRFWASHGLSVRAYTALSIAGCRSVSDVRALGRCHFVNVRNCGRATLREIENLIGSWNDVSVGRTSIEGSSYDPNDLLSEAKRWRELGARASSRKRAGYMRFAAECEALVSRSLHMPSVVD
jgi:hypothetical protein